MIERLAHLGWPDCVRLSNGAVELIERWELLPGDTFDRAAFVMDSCDLGR